MPVICEYMCHKQWYIHKPSVHNQQSVQQNVSLIEKEKLSE